MTNVNRNLLTAHEAIEHVDHLLTKKTSNDGRYTYLNYNEKTGELERVGQDIKGGGLRRDQALEKSLNALASYFSKNKLTTTTQVEGTQLSDLVQKKISNMETSTINKLFGISSSHKKIIHAANLLFESLKPPEPDNPKAPDLTMQQLNKDVEALRQVRDNRTDPKYSSKSAASTTGSIPTNVVNEIRNQRDKLKTMNPKSQAKDILTTQNNILNSMRGYFHESSLPKPTTDVRAFITKVNTLMTEAMQSKRMAPDLSQVRWDTEIPDLPS